MEQIWNYMCILNLQNEQKAPFADYLQLWVVAYKITLAIHPNMQQETGFLRSGKVQPINWNIF